MKYPGAFYSTRIICTITNSISSPEKKLRDSALPEETSSIMEKLSDIPDPVISFRNAVLDVS